MKCPNCGGDISEGELFCVHCGVELNNLSAIVQHQGGHGGEAGWFKLILANIARIKWIVPYIIIGLLITIIVQNMNLYKMSVQNGDGIDGCTRQAGYATDYASEAADYSSEAVDAAHEAAYYASNCPGNY